MSYSDPHNPFASPAMPPSAPAATLAKYPTGMEYMRAYHYIFENPNWTNNILWGFLCLASTMLIPVLGQLVFIGYQYEVIEALYLARGARHPDFDINRFADYLGRSIWPFLVNLILTLPLVIVMYLGIAIVVLLAAAGASIGGDTLGPVLAVVIGVIGFVAWIALAIVAGGVTTAMTLRAGLAQDFAAGFDVGWAVDFLKKTWVELALTILFLTLSGMILAMLGMLAFCIGVFAAAAIIGLASSHLMYQLYAVYLGRGGRPIPLKPAVAMQPQAYMPPPPAPPKY